MSTVTLAPLVFSYNKKELRSSIRGLRREIVTLNGREKAQQLAERADDFPLPPEDGIIAGYWPLADELDPRPLMMRLWEKGWSLALPVVIRKNEPLVFRRYEPKAPLIKGIFNVFHLPDTVPDVQPDWVLVPLLAFDAQGHRLGYGGGFYDRTLAQLRASKSRQDKSIMAVGVALAEQEVGQLPIEATDQALNALITPSFFRLF